MQTEAYDGMDDEDRAKEINKIFQNSKVSARTAKVLEITQGPRVMCSTPPAIKRSPSPALIALLACEIGDKPEEHNRLTVSPGTS